MRTLYHRKERRVCDSREIQRVLYLDGHCGFLKLIEQAVLYNNTDPVYQHLLVVTKAKDKHIYGLDVFALAKDPVAVDDLEIRKVNLDLFQRDPVRVEQNVAIGRAVLPIVTAEDRLERFDDETVVILAK